MLPVFALFFVPWRLNLHANLGSEILYPHSPFTKACKIIFSCENMNMKRLRLLKKNIIINPLKYTVAFLVGLVFASTAVYAWQAVWHGTDWIKSGEVIRAKEIGENMQYLYEQIEDLKGQINNLNTQINNSSSSQITINQMPSGTVVAGCTQVPDNRPFSAYKWKCWGGAFAWRSNGYDMKCPANTFKFKTESTMRVREGMENDGSTHLERYISGLLCIKN